VIGEIQEERDRSKNESTMSLSEDRGSVRLNAIGQAKREDPSSFMQIGRWWRRVGAVYALSLEMLQPQSRQVGAIAPNEGLRHAYCVAHHERNCMKIEQRNRI